MSKQSKNTIKKGSGYKAEDEMPEDMKKAKKAEGADEGDEDEGDEEDEGDDEGMDKAILAADDLEKGLAELERLGKRAPGRKAELLVKASRGKLSKAESVELARLAAGEGSIAKALDDDEIVKAVDVSPALDALASAVGTMADALDAKLEKSLDAQGEFNGALAKALISVGEVVRAQNEALGELRGKIEKALDAPAREAKAPPRAAPAPAAKAPASAPVVEDGKVSPRVAMLALEAEFNKALEAGDTGKLHVLRDDIARVQAGGVPSSVAGARAILEFTKAHG